MTIRAAALALLLLAMAAGSGAAQTPDSATRWSDPWLLSYFPYAAGGAGGGPVLMGRVRYFQPATWQNRSTYRADLVAEAGIGLHGSRIARIAATAPLLAPGWRAIASLETIRNTRANFFGLGNATERSDDRIAADEFAYRMHRTSYRATAEVTRRLGGPLWLAAGGGASFDRFYALSTTSEFSADYGARRTENDLHGKAELVLDTRDTEWDPRRGILAEAGVQQGSARDGYTRIFGMLRAYYDPRPGTVLAARVGASDLHGTPPLAARFEIPTWEDPTSVYGGGTNRGLSGNRFIGTGVLLGSAEMRQQLKNFRNAATVGVVAFVDAGRVFEGERLRLTTDDLQVSGGLGLVLRVFRANSAILNVADGPDGVHVGVSGGWAF